MATPSEKVVMPGEKLGLEEEYLADRNTYTEEGNVYSAVFGEAEPDNGRIIVKSFGTEIRRIEKGMPALGVIVSDIGKVMFVKIDEIKIGKTLYVASEDGKIIKERSRQIHRNGQYGTAGHSQERHATPCKEGDAILARIARIEQGVYMLDIYGAEMGVIYARCSNCGADMEHNEKLEALVCRVCGHVEHSKVSPFYGKPNTIKSLLEKELAH
ncbi:MAG: exosome complex RNA-binding protein Csl4 [Candidatus Micrarchaeaceae archaeon]